MNRFLLFLLVILVFYMIWSVLTKKTTTVNGDNEFIKHRLDVLKYKVKSLFDLYNVSTDVIHLSESNTSYCYDKRIIYIQFYTRRGDLHEMKDLIEMTLHELSHILCKHCIDIHDHSPEYYKHYNKVIMNAIELGIMDKTNCIFESNCAISQK